MATPDRILLDKAIRRQQSALEDVYTYLCYLAEVEMEKLARRFPKRRIEFHSGMGSSQIRIRRPGRRIFDDYEYAGTLAWTNWPDGLERPASPLWDAIEAVESITHGIDPGIGSIIYENGKRLSGLT